MNLKTYEVHNLSSDLIVSINAFSAEQALLLVDFHENKESLLKTLPVYIKNHDLDLIKTKHVFSYGKRSVGFNNWCVNTDKWNSNLLLAWICFIMCSCNKVN